MKNYAFVCMLLAIAQAYGFEPISSKPYLTPTSSPTNSINVNWNTENLASTQITYGLTSDLNDTVVIAGLRHYHHIKLDGLLPGTEYFYRVLPLGDMKTFTTFPLESDSVSFIVYGDTRGDSSVHQSVINGMASLSL